MHPIIIVHGGAGTWKNKDIRHANQALEKAARAGCGTYANKYCGASSTGMGEAIIRSVLARRATEYVELGLSPQEAADESIQYLHEKTGGKSGIMVLDRTGRIGVGFNTAHMLWCARGTRNGET